MAPTVEVIPLFPLGTVLFPGLLLPLNIFEERYRTLVRDLLERPESERLFGVIAIRQGRETGIEGVTALFEVGCAAQVRRVDEQEDGRFHIVSTGGRRFRLESLDDVSKPYLQGRVTWLDVDDPSDETAAPRRDDAPPTDSAADEAALVPRAQAAFADYLAALGTAREVEIELPDLPAEPELLSYLVAATVVVDLADKQALLAEETAAGRLRAELTLLRRETMLLGRLTAAPAPELTRMPYNPN